MPPGRAPKAPTRSGRFSSARVGARRFTGRSARARPWACRKTFTLNRCAPSPSGAGISQARSTLPLVSRQRRCGGSSNESMNPRISCWSIVSPDAVRPLAVRIHRGCPADTTTSETFPSTARAIRPARREDAAADVLALGGELAVPAPATGAVVSAARGLAGAVGAGFVRPAPVRRSFSDSLSAFRRASTAKFPWRSER